MSHDEHRRGSTLKESIGKQIDFLFQDTNHLIDGSSPPELTSVPAFSSDPKDPDSSFLHMEDSDDDNEDGSAAPLAHLPSPPPSPPKVIPTSKAECFVLQPVPEHMKFRKRKRLALGMEVAPRPRVSSRASSCSKIASWDIVDANDEHFVTLDMDDEDPSSPSSYNSDFTDSVFRLSPRMTWGPRPALSATCAPSTASTLEHPHSPTSVTDIIPHRPRGLARLRSTLPTHALKSFQCILAASDVLSKFCPDDMPAGSFYGFFDEDEWAWAFGDVNEESCKGAGRWDIRSGSTEKSRVGTYFAEPWLRTEFTNYPDHLSQLCHDHHTQVYQAHVSPADAQAVSPQTERVQTEVIASQAHVDRMTQELVGLLERARHYEKGAESDYDEDEEEESCLWEWEREAPVAWGCEREAPAVVWAFEKEAPVARAESECLGVDDLDEQKERKRLIDEKDQ
ncbi:hypothetical protein L198_04505 [Cryptococcus wingfieldii CBS 7118]|uniref:Uncharacterized protein n=1 Tax=Cryptococcus wingfieldii CBS 7118 TaxID=1295528 RepID=A0A1E3J706_9TREE|nr:hypothetical protein L198_04505 [Cryptococcus wingfieldii CBS 7118]ODN95886.1 hypothetical protein L198_04505 [Cryptococcus wingfieldii CBS 7118]